MAKKKKNENTLSYLQMPLPEGSKYSKMTKLAFGGLNKRFTMDTGELSKESNVSTNAYPYLIPSEVKESVLSGYDTPISMSAFDDFLLVVYGKNRAIYVDYITADGDVHTGILKESGATAKDDVPRSIVQFNVYDTPTDPLTGQFVKRLLVFPDKKSMYMRIVKINKNETIDMNTADTNVLYYKDTGDKKTYSVIRVFQETDADGNVSYSRKWTDISKTVQEGEELKTCFPLDDLSAEIKEYYNDTPEVDESGATIYPPPDTASHNCYYRNTYNSKDTDTGFSTDVYRWCEYETCKKDEDGEFVKDESGNFVPDGGTTYGWKVSVPPTMPSLKYATVHMSRVFGVDDDRVYASGYNDYTNWNLDTVDEYNESNAWCSPSQSNTKAGGNFTGITTFQGHVVCFKRDFMHEIYNTKNPFRIQDIYAEGAIDNRTIQDVDGKLIFVSEDDVKVYTGSNPRIIGYNLNMPRYKYAVSGTDNRNYYLYCEPDTTNKYLYVYDTYTDLWSEQHIDSQVISFAHNKNGMYMLCANGCVYKMDTNQYKHEWSFETDLITNKTVDIKRIKKLQMLVDIPEAVGGYRNYADDENNPANVRVYILYDDEVFDENKSHLVYTSKKNGKLPVRVKPRMTANYGIKLHFEGAGYVKLYELEIFVEQGGAMYVGL